MLKTLLDALLPVFLGIALGYLGGWTRDLDNKQVSQLNAFVMDFAVPAAIFGTVVQASRTILYQQLPLAAILSLSMLILYLLTYVMARYGYAVPAAAASVQALTTSLPNYASAGLPLIAALLGAGHLVSVAVAIACGSIVVSPITLIILNKTSRTSGRVGIGRAILSTFRKPIVLAPLAAVAFVMAGIRLSEPLTRSVSLIGQAGGGTALFLTGLILSAQKVRLGTSVNIQTLAANVLHPLLAAGLAWAFAVSPLTMREAIVLSALPVGFFGILFGLRFGVASEVVSSTLIASTVLSAATLAAAIYLTAGMG